MKTVSDSPQYSRKVLLVDDDNTYRLIGKRALEKAGLEVIEAQDGIEAVAKFNEWQPDIILMDVFMPELDGYDACARIREQPNGQSVPIVMITSLDDAESIIKSSDAGATDFIVKPVSWLIAIHRLVLLMRLDKDTLKQINEDFSHIIQRFRSEQSGETAGYDGDTAEHREWFQDIYELEEIVDKEILELLLQNFLKDTAKITQAMQDAYDEQKYPHIQSRAQLLQSKAATFSANRLTHLCKVLGASCETQNDEKISECLQEIQKELSQIRRMLLDEFFGEYDVLL